MIVIALLSAFFAPYEGKGEFAYAVVRNGRVEAVHNPDAVFRMASLSKVVTAAAIIRSGANLDAPTGYGGVTLRHLLTHTSGIDDAFFGNSVPIAEPVTLEEHFRRRPPRFGRRAGEAVVYSNEGLALAGYLASRPMPFEQFAARHVFLPLGMTSSTFAQPPPFAVVPSGEEHIRMIQAPAGAMVSTAADMARLMLALLPDVREKRYAMFAYGGAFFHTGRSGHESVLYLDPEKGLGLFLVHTGGLDRDLRKRFVAEFGGWRVTATHPRIEPGSYRPFLLPKHRIESAANVATDARVRVDGNVIHLRMPPFARGQPLTFVDGVTQDGYTLTGQGDRFTITGPLFEPQTFQRIAVSGRTKVIAAAMLWLVVLLGGRLFTAIALLFPLAPVAFLLNYMPRAPETRPFHVATSVHLALAVLALAIMAALASPLIARRTRRKRHVIAAAAAVLLALLVAHLCFFPLLR